jgi:hypothetical protein
MQQKMTVSNLGAFDPTTSVYDYSEAKVELTVEDCS